VKKRKSLTTTEVRTPERTIRSRVAVSTTLSRPTLYIDIQIYIHNIGGYVQMLQKISNQNMQKCNELYRPDKT